MKKPCTSGKDDLVQANKKMWSCTTFELKKTMFVVRVDIGSLDRAGCFLEDCVDEAGKNRFKIGWRDIESEKFYC